MMDQRVSLITLAVGNLAAATEFYQALGWKQVETGDGPVVFDLIGQSLGLYPKDDLARDMGLQPSDIGGFSGVTFGYNVPSRAEVDDLTALAKAAGARIIRSPREIFWGGYIAYFADLDGHVWEVAHNPYSPLGPKGEFQWNGAA